MLGFLEDQGRELSCLAAELRPIHDTHEFYEKHGYEPSLTDPRLYDKLLIRD